MQKGDETLQVRFLFPSFGVLPIFWLEEAEEELNGSYSWVGQRRRGEKSKLRNQIPFFEESVRDRMDHKEQEFFLFSSSPGFWLVPSVCVFSPRVLCYFSSEFLLGSHPDDWLIWSLSFVTMTVYSLSPELEKAVYIGSKTSGKSILQP